MTSAIPAVFAMVATLALGPALRAEEGHRHHQAPVAAEGGASKVNPYPLDTCIVSGGKLGEMGKPVVFTCKEQEIKLCCKPCRKKFDRAPEQYLKKLQPEK